MARTHSSDFGQCLTRLESQDSLTQELEFQHLRSRATELIDEIIEAFHHTTNPQVRRYLFILIAESRMPQAAPVIQSVIDSREAPLLQVYAGLTHQYVVNNQVQMEPPESREPLLGMRRKLGSVAGIPVYVHASLLIWLPLLIFQALSARTLIILLASVVVHELAHAVTSRALGLGPGTITLWLFGGVFIPTEYPGLLGKMIESQRLKYAAMIGAGPLSNFLLAGIALLWAYFSPNGGILRDVAMLNLNLALFNLIPVPPLDGEKLASALLLRFFSRQRISLGLGVLAIFGLISVCALSYQFDIPYFGTWIAILFWGSIYAFQASRIPSEKLENQQRRVVENERRFSGK